MFVFLLALRNEFHPSCHLLGYLEVEHHQVATTNVESRQMFDGVLRVVNVLVYYKRGSARLLRLATMLLDTSFKRMDVHPNLANIAVLSKYIVYFFVCNFIWEVPMR